MLLPDSLNEKPVKTTCPYCGVGCGVIATVKDNGKVDIQGDKEHPANYGRLCSKGSALGETVDLEHRLLNPSINGEEVEWESAIKAVADGFNDVIKKHGPEAVAFYVSGQLLTEDYYVANKLMKGFIGSANIDTNSRLCMSSAVAGHKRAFGNDTVGLCYEDLEQAEAIIAIGSNLAWCHPVLYQRIEKSREENDAKLIIVDPRRTTSCDTADTHLPIKPGTDSVLYNGLLVYLAEHEKIDENYVEEYTDGFEEALVTAQVLAGSTANVAEICEISEQDVIAFYELFLNTEKVISFFSMGINQSSSGVDKVNSIINAHLASGKVGKAGTGAFSITGQPNAMGGREVGGLASTLAAHMDFNDDEKERVKRFWNSPTIAQKPGLKAVDLFNDVKNGKVKAIWIMATNPVVSMPNADLVQEAIKECELVVVSDCIKDTDTTKLANILLPAHAWAEKSGTVTNSERCISRQTPFLKPAGQAKADWWIVCEVAKAMGFDEGFEYEKVNEVFREHAELSGFENNGERDFDISAFNEISEENYNDFKPIQWPVNQAAPNGTKRLLEQGRFYTKNKKAQFISVQPRMPVESLSKKYPLVLNTGRVRDHWHTMTRTAKSQRLSKHIKEPFAQCHPNTAKFYDIKKDGLVEITSDWGKVVVRIDITERQREGEIFIPLHWNDQFSAKARIDAVVNPHVDPISGQPEFKHTPINIKPVKHTWFGFLLSREEYNVEDLSYWTKLREQDNWRLEFSDYDVKNISYFKSIIDGKNNFDWVEYHDEFIESYRYLFYDRSGIQGCIFIATQYENLPSRAWLSEQFSNTDCKDSKRSKLFAAISGANQIDPGPIVCSCFNVGENIIKEYIKEDRPKDIACIGEKLRAGTNCGSCRPELTSLLEQTLKV